MAALQYAHRSPMDRGAHDTVHRVTETQQNHAYTHTWVVEKILSQICILPPSHSTLNLFTSQGLIRGVYRALLWGVRKTRPRQREVDSMQ